MNHSSVTEQELLEELRQLREQLEECDATIRAISAGEVDAFIVRKGADDQVLVLDGVDRPYKLLIEEMQQGAATLAADGTLIYANCRFAQLVGLPLADLVGQHFTEIFRSSDPRAVASLASRARHQKVEHELTFHRRDGQTLPVLVAANSLVEADGIICVTVTDLSQQKQHELEREKLAEAHAVRAAAESAAQMLREADRRKDEFLAMLAHELRNPLGPLRNGLEVLNRTSSQEPQVRKVRELMSRQLEYLVRLVDDLLDVSRVTQGKIQLRKETIDLRNVIAHAVDSCRSTIESHRHGFEFDVPDATLPVLGDPVRLAQCLINLLNNATKFTPPGGRIRLSVTAGDGHVALHVRDTGVGIAPEMLSKVFDLFAQADPSESRSEGGLGIGLTLARRLAELHGGHIEAASDGLGQGSEFSLHLPLARQDLPAPAMPPRSAPPTRRIPRRILVVDDNQDAADSLADLLRLIGHDVRQVYDGREVLAAALAHRPDVILLDIGLPGMSGYDVARHLRTESSLHTVWIIALSGYGSDEDRQRAQEAGFDSHFVKPLELADLEALLNSLPV